MTLTIDKLNQIEREAESAPATMLRLHLAEVRAGLESALADTRDYADALVLKLEHRLRCECVGEVCVSATPAVLISRIGMAEQHQVAA